MTFSGLKVVVQARPPKLTQTLSHKLIEGSLEK